MCQLELKRKNLKKKTTFAMQKVGGGAPEGIPGAVNPCNVPVRRSFAYDLSFHEEG